MIESVQIEEGKTDGGIFYRITSTAESADYLVLVMGYGGSLRVWPATFVNKLASRFNVVTYDNRGTGLSIIPKDPEEYTIKVMANDIFDVISTAGIKRHHVLGYSMGGCMALQYVHDYLENVVSLFLMSSTAGGPLYVKPDKEMSSALANPAGKTLWDMYMSTFSLMYSPEVFERCMPKFKEIYEAAKDFSTKPIGLAGHSNAFKGFDGSSYPANITVPVTLLAGKNDRLMPVKNSVNMFEKFPDAKLILWDDCEHGPHIQDEQGVVDLILKSCTCQLF